jgi:hypothetical protein
MVQPLIDADCLVYECCFGSDKVWEGEGPAPFDVVATLLDNKVANICAIVESTTPPILYLTGRGNFRYAIAKRKPYKERRAEKHFHHKNIRAYIQGRYDVCMSDGLEADDLMAIEQTRRQDTIICSIDKDLRQVPGLHFSWEKGNIPSFGPARVDGYGWIKLSTDRKKITGMGDKFFLSQTLTGDVVDSIPGLPKCGAVAAFSILEPTTEMREGAKAVYCAYKNFYGTCGAYKEMLEQFQLLWMTRKLKRNGEPFLYGQVNDYTR